MEAKWSDTFLQFQHFLVVLDGLLLSPSLHLPCEPSIFLLPFLPPPFPPTYHPFALLLLFLEDAPPLLGKWSMACGFFHFPFFKLVCIMVADSLVLSRIRTSSQLLVSSAHISLCSAPGHPAVAEFHEFEFLGLDACQAG